MHEPSPKLIHVEFQFLPIEEMRFDKKAAQGLYGRLADTGFAYDNLEIEPGKATLSANRGESAESACRLASHSLTIEEKKPSFPVNEFSLIVRTVLRCLSQAKKCPPIVVQRTRIQCLAQPLRITPLGLLSEKAANVYNRIQPFGRPPSFFGLRFRFLPLDMILDDATAQQDEEKGDKEGFISLRFETYAQDTGLIWMEVAATDPVMPPVEIPETASLEHRIQCAYRFLEKHSIEFLNQFDEPKETDNGTG